MKTYEDVLADDEQTDSEIAELARSYDFSIGKLPFSGHSYFFKNLPDGDRLVIESNSGAPGVTTPDGREFFILREYDEDGITRSICVDPGPSKYLFAEALEEVHKMPSPKELNCHDTIILKAKSIEEAKAILAAEIDRLGILTEADIQDALPDTIAARNEVDVSEDLHIAPAPNL